MTEDLLTQPIIWVDTNEKLDELCLRWETAPLLAIDTEFIRTQTYYPIPGLFQINDGEKNYLIDPSKVQDFYPLVEIFDNENIVKVFHSCSEDLEVFQHTIGCTPKNLFDTQIAGAFCGYGFSVGFANMVRAAMQIDLPKTETRSDWLARPLSQAQIFYAALDVEYLYKLAHHLISRLKDNARISWVQEESQGLVKKYFDNQDPSNSYLRVKTAWKLTARQLYILKKLAVWRENYAQEKNEPRNRILKEHALFDIAKFSPTHISQLRNIEGVTERMIKRFGNKLIQLVEEGLKQDESNLPSRLPKPLTSEEKVMVKKLKRIVERKSLELDIPVELIARKKDYEDLARVSVRENFNDVLERVFDNWRKDIVVEDIRQKMIETNNDENDYTDIP